MSVTFYVFQAQENLDIDRDAVTADEYQVPLYLLSDEWRSTEMNATNASAIMILDAAGFEVEQETTGDLWIDCFATATINGSEDGLVGSMTADEADQAASNLFMGAQYLQAEEIIDEPGKAKIISLGLDWDRIERYADGMKRLANLAREFETVIHFA